MMKRNLKQQKQARKHHFALTYFSHQPSGFVWFLYISLFFLLLHHVCLSSVYLSDCLRARETPSVQEVQKGEKGKR
jgi:hypothetical protein